MTAAGAFRNGLRSRIGGLFRRRPGGGERLLEGLPLR